MGGPGFPSMSEVESMLFTTIEELDKLEVPCCLLPIFCVHILSLDPAKQHLALIIPLPSRVYILCETVSLVASCSRVVVRV